MYSDFRLCFKLLFVALQKYEKKVGAEQCYAIEFCIFAQQINLLGESIMSKGTADYYPTCKTGMKYD